MILDAIAVILLILPPLDWLAAVVLTQVSRQHPDILALRERAVTAVILAIVATLAGLLAWARLGILPLSGGMALLVVAVGLILASVPSLYWLALLATGRFRIDGGRP